MDGKEYVPAQNLVAVKRKRIEFARALAVRPEFLLLNEAISGLNDTEIQDTIKFIYSKRDDLGITILGM